MTLVRFSKAILNFLFSLLAVCDCAGQRYLLSSLPVEKELSSRQITSIFQDSKGFIWIGTEDGLNLYNANSVKIFKHATRLPSKGFGDAKPISDNNTLEGKANNRTVEFVKQ